MVRKEHELVNPKAGSFFFIGALVLDLELEADEPFAHDRCGSCRRCIDACPTGAIVDDRVLDATKCISYLTIEKRGEIPAEMRPQIGELLYGCDICQDVCPWNVSFAQELKTRDFQPRAVLRREDTRALACELLAMDDVGFREKFRGSPMKRAKRSGLARNAAVVLGNIGNPEDANALAAALDDADPMVRDHAKWALAQLTAGAATANLPLE